MDSTETQVAVAGGREERQLVAGRYRLASFHRGDETTEVWRALDEKTTQVVSLEFLRDPDPAEKERFLAGARRLQSVQQPSVMRVAAIHDDPGATFIVFEHLVHIPVPLEWLKPVEEPAAIATPPAPAEVTASAPTPTAVTTVEQPAAPEAPMVVVADEKPTDRGLSLLTYAIRTRELSLIDTALLTESADELLAIIRSELKAIRVDPTVLSDLRSYRPNFAFLLSPFKLIGGAARRATTARPSVKAPQPKVERHEPARAPRLKAVKAPNMAAPPRVETPRVSRAPRLHVRWGRVLTRGLSLGVLAAVLVALPSEMIATVGNVANDLTVAIKEKLATVSLSAPTTLQRASFELPPLSAYSASFEAQAPYPQASPNGTVEWVVALRNTGSVGWYLGIDGAQASLALADGTTAGVQTTQYVGPGQVGWFIVHFPAPSEAGTSKVSLLPRIDGRGPMPDLGIYATVTVSPKP